jgi:L-amino acid N-acyltransferase YncA
MSSHSEPGAGRADGAGPEGGWAVRDATAADAAACALIYRPYVLETAVTFELDPPGELEMARRIRGAWERHAWLVLLDHPGLVVGYAYGGPFKARPAYRWACEVSVYRDRTGRGGGRLLYASLLDRLAARGYRTAAAGMTQPNEPSGRLHTALGFEPVGTVRSVGWKLDGWHDVAWVQRALGDPHAGPGAPPEPR